MARNKIGTGFWGPGVRLMGNLQFAGKAGVISAVFLVPIILLGYFFVSAQNAQIASTAKERQGVDAYRVTAPVLTAMLKIRNATRAQLGGLDTKAKFDAAKTEVSTSLAALEKFTSESGDPLGIRDHVEKAKSAWTTASQVSGGVDAQGKTVFGPVSSALVDLTAHIGDESGLVLDPDIDSYYLFSALAVLPQTAEDVGQLWGWGSYALSLQANKKDFELKDVKRYAVWASNATKGLNDINDYLKKSFDATPASKTALDLTALSDAAAFVSYAKEHEALIKIDGMSATKHYATGEAALVKLQSFNEKGWPTLDDLLAARIAAIKGKLYTSGAIVLAVLLLGAYLFFGFFRVTKSGLTTVANRLEELARGDLNAEAVTPFGKDETAEVLKSVQSVQATLTGFQAAQDEMARQHELGNISHIMNASALPGAYGELASATNAMVKTHVEVKFKALSLISNYVQGNFDDSMPELPGEKRKVTEAVNGARSTMKAAVDAAVTNERVVQALNKASTNVMIADAGNNIIFMNETVLKMMQGNETELRKELPQFDANRLIGQNIDVFHKNPAHQRNMLASLSTSYRTQIKVGSLYFGLIANPIISALSSKPGLQINDRDHNASQVNDAAHKLGHERNHGYRTILDDLSDWLDSHGEYLISQTEG